ncbi:MAG: tRNA (5-methylaminomethyl-2-thiouridine)(34)-methyltransferase MnmD [Muribaculaceae bacterium]
MKRSIEITADGSATIYLPEIDEHYHSIKGALTESQHIYRDCALRHCTKNDIRVLEIGFGTGLNCIVTALEPNKKINYFTLELYPLQKETITAVGYAKLFDEIGEKLYISITDATWNESIEISTNFTINKLNIDFTNPNIELPTNIDVVYFDAFAPEKQPEMWSEDGFARIYACMATGGILTTYCAKGDIRRRLQSVGFTVERISGPKNGKREIIRATK